MPRYNPYGNRQMQPEQYDTGSVPYISYDSPDKEKLMTEVLDRGQQRYDLTQSAIGKYLEENAKGDFSDKDYAPVTTALNNRLEKIKQTVKDKYQGEYSSAANEILQELGKARNIFFQAEAEKKKEDKYGPLLDKMKAEKKLLWEPGKGDPRERAAFDQNGNYVPRDYSGFVEKSDYEKLIAEDVVNGIDKNVKESGLISSGTEGILKSVTTKGLAALGNTETEREINLNKIATEYAPLFHKKSTAGIDPDMQNGNDIEYIKGTIRRLASDVTANQYVTDQLAVSKAKARAKAAAGNKDSLRISSFGAPISGNVEDNPYATRTVPLKDAFDKKIDTEEGIPGNIPWLSSLGTGMWNGIEEVESKIKEKQKEIDSLDPNKYIEKNRIEKLKGEVEKYKAEEERIKPAMEILNTYKADKTKELQAQGQPIPQTNKEWVELFDTDKEYTYKTVDQDFTISPMAQEGIKTVWRNNPALTKQIAYRIANKSDLGVVDQNTAADELGVDVNSFRTQILNNDFNYNKNTGEFYTIIEKGDVKNNKFSSSDKKGGTTVYFSLDDVTRGISEGLKKVKTIESNKSAKDEVIPLPNGLYIYYLGKDKRYAVMMQSASGNLTSIDGNKYSVEQLRGKMQDLVDGHVYERYTKNSLTYQQQLKQQQLEQQMLEQTNQEE